MPSLSPRSYANNRDLAAKSAQASSAHQGYLMMDNIAFGSRSSCAAQAWPDQARGAALDACADFAARSRSLACDLGVGMGWLGTRSSGYAGSPQAAHATGSGG